MWIKWPKTFINVQFFETVHHMFAYNNFGSHFPIIIFASVTILISTVKYEAGLFIKRQILGRISSYIQSKKEA